MTSLAGIHDCVVLQITVFARPRWASYWIAIPNPACASKSGPPKRVYAYSKNVACTHDLRAGSYRVRYPTRMGRMLSGCTRWTQISDRLSIKMRFLKTTYARPEPTTYRIGCRRRGRLVFNQKRRSFGQVLLITGRESWDASHGTQCRFIANAPSLAPPIRTRFR